MVRNTLGAVLAVIAAVAVVLSPFFDWYGEREGENIRWPELFTTGGGLTAADAGLFTGLFLPMLVAAVVAVLGALLRSRLVVLAGGVIALGFVTLWMVRQYQETDGLTIGADGLVEGAALALAGSVLLLVAAGTMAGRRYGWVRRREVVVEPAPEPRRQRPRRQRTRRGQVVEGPRPADGDGPTGQAGPAPPEEPPGEPPGHGRDAA